MPHNLLKHSSVLFLSLVMANGLSYLLHIFLARHLGPAAYGEFGSFMAIFMILSVPVSTIQTVIAKFVARYQSRGEAGKIGSLLSSSIRKLSVCGTGILVLIFISSPFIADFLHADSALPVLFVGLTVLFSVVLLVNRGGLQGTQKFNSLALNHILESLFRLIIGVLLVASGLGVNGAILGYGLAYLAAFLATLIPLREYLDKRDPDILTREICRFILPVFTAGLLITILVDGPTLYVRHFYSAEFTGCWNAALNLARVILFAGISISLVMFGKISSSVAEIEKKRIFRRSLIYAASISLMLSLLFIFFSEVILTALFGPVYSRGAVLLQWMGPAVSLISVLQVWINYRLAGFFIFRGQVLGVKA